MNRPRRLLLLALAAVLAAGGAWYFYSHREPSFNGKRLSVWLEDGYPFISGLDDPRTRRRADEALHMLGKKAVPTLLRMIEAKDSPLRLKLMELAKRQSMVKIHFTLAELYERRGLAGFRVLGPEAREALPELVRIFRDPGLAKNAACAMAMIGADAVPILRSGLTNQDAQIRRAAVMGLFAADTNAWVAVPDLRQRLQDSSDLVRETAAWTLGCFHRNPDTVLPALLSSAQEDSNSSIREKCLWAISCFGTQAVAFVPALREMLASTNSNEIGVRVEVKRALDRIERPPGDWR